VLLAEVIFSTVKAMKAIHDASASKAANFFYGLAMVGIAIAVVDWIDGPKIGWAHWLLRYGLPPIFFCLMGWMFSSLKRQKGKTKPPISN
jgi:hypothetical protein